jgi:hypothetical protein
MCINIASQMGSNPSPPQSMSDLEKNTTKSAMLTLFGHRGDQAKVVSRGVFEFLF